MSIPHSPITHPRLLLAPPLLAALLLAACGGGGDDTPAAPAAAAAAAAEDSPTAQILAAHQAGVAANVLQTGLKVPGFPHAVDVYQPSGATRAIVFLHGEGGTTWQLAHDLGFNQAMAPAVPKTVNWDWLVRNGVIAVFAQGQKSSTGVPTWSNYVFNSGQNDVAFLKALSSWVRQQYGVSDLSLSGHSAGGVMAARMWCEGTASYKAYVSLAGPMPSSTYPLIAPTCTPQALAPYFMIVGGKDSKLPQFTTGKYVPSPAQVAAGLTQGYLISEWSRTQDRSRALCGEIPQLGSSTIDATGPTWNACNAMSRYRIVTAADHPIASLEQASGSRMVDVIAGFVSRVP